MEPVIGIPQMGNDPFRIYMKSKYARSLRQTGANVRWIPLDGSKSSIASLLECDGLLLPGGPDIEPCRYSQQKSGLCGKTNPRRDEAEWKILAAFLPTKKPVLCICRGLQMLNVFLGGTLHQHIPGHSDFKSRGRGFHEVTIIPGSRLAQIIGTPKMFVNSLHHQAIDSTGEKLAICAISQDGIAEAVVHTEHPFCIGVQWHPEHMYRKDLSQRKLFEAFLNACK